MPAAPPAPAAPAAAPAKPAPAAPAAPAPSKPAPSAPPAPGGEEPTFMGEFATELNQLAGEDLQPVQVKRPKDKKDAKPPVKPPGQTAPAEPVKPAEGEPVEGTPADGAAAAEPTTVPAIRKAYSELKKRTQEEYVPKIQRLEARVKELESANPQEVTALQERLTAAEKRRDELENEIHFVDYSKSKDYQEKFAKPYQQAWAKALYEITQLSKFESDGSTRKATEKDILALANLPLDQLDKTAEEWFPNSSARVIRHVEKIKDLAEAQSDALEKARTEGAERAKTSEVTRKANDEKTVKLLEGAHSQVIKQWPKMFGAIEGDAEGNALLEKGEAMYQRAFKPHSQEKPPTAEEAIQLHAMVRAKVRNHDRLALWLKKANAQIKELETALAEYEKSEPHGGSRGGGVGAGNGVKAMLQDGLDELDALSKKGP